MRLVFKNSALESLAEKNLSTRLVMALQSLTIDDFIAEVLDHMRAPRQIRKSHVKIGFVGKSLKSPFFFEGHTRMERVFQKICSIEASRELSRNSSSEDLNK